MQAFKHKNLTTKGFTVLTVILVFAVFRHVTRLNTFVNTGGEDDSVDEGRGRRSLFFRDSHRVPAVKRCLPHVNTLPPVVPTDGGAMGDIKRITADWEHISTYVQSCDFQSNRNGSGGAQKTKGIVIPSAGHAMFAHTWVVVTILRETLGCSLPIEVVYNGEEELDVVLAERLKVCPICHQHLIYSIVRLLQPLTSFCCNRHAHQWSDTVHRHWRR